MTMIAFGLAACRSGEVSSISYTPDQNYQLTILYSSNYPNTDSMHKQQGSVTAKVDLIKTIRSEVESRGNHFILVSGGSVIPPEHEIPNCFNDLNYDAMVVSSYMFNQPVADIKKFQEKSSAPFISANLFESETGKPAFDAYTLVDADNLTIAIVGVTSLEITKEQITNLSGLDLTYPKDRDCLQLIRQLEEQADVVILATHTGHIQGAGPGIALDTIPGVDLVIGEHLTRDTVSGESFRCNEYLTRVDLEFRNGELNITNREQLFIHNRAAPLMSI